MNDAPAQRTIRIGRAMVGLIGLDQAIGRALAAGMAAEEAAAVVLAEVKHKNYIPDGMEADYCQAIAEVYQRRLGENDGEIPERLVIRILGPACVSCNRIYTMSIEVLQKHGIAADIESISDLDEIWRHGVVNTPAMIINNELKSSGRLPTPSEIDGWIKDAAGI